ncbi:hypothetical protein L0F76_13865, partial [Staphylococcus aureus]|nr:hypothetical protein [Staphylococcus aureus]
LFFYCSVLGLLKKKKIQNHIKNRKSKKFDHFVEFLSQSMFCPVPLYLWLCAFNELSLSLMHSYHCGRNSEIYVTVVNRSSTLS